MPVAPTPPRTITADAKQHPGRCSEPEGIRRRDVRVDARDQVAADDGTTELAGQDERA